MLQLDFRFSGVIPTRQPMPMFNNIKQSLGSSAIKHLGVFLTIPKPCFKNN